MPATRTKERQPRDVAINLRANRRQRALIDRAAETLGKNRSDFMLEAACREADAVLLDRRFFLLDDKAYRRMMSPLRNTSRNVTTSRRSTPEPRHSTSGSSGAPSPTRKPAALAPTS